jgi:ABC-type uncharacterized transport system auxiliary subunit
MFKKLFIAAAISVTLLGCSTTDKNQENIQNTSIKSVPIPEYPVDYFFKNSVTRSVTLSPKANYVAMLKPYKDRMNIFFFSSY